MVSATHFCFKYLLLSTGLFFLLPIIGFTQANGNLNLNKVLFGVKSGISLTEFESNFSGSIANDYERLNSGVRPFIGLYVESPKLGRFSGRISSNYTWRSSHLESYRTYQFESIDYEGLLRFELFSYLYISSGYLYSDLQNTSVDLKRQRVFEDKYPFSGVSVEMIDYSAIPLNLEVNINTKAVVGLGYHFPINGAGIRNFQFSIMIPINPGSRVKPGMVRVRKARAEEGITNLKDGILLVRLQTSEKKIKALEKAGRIEDANNLVEEQAFVNEKIIQAFKANYDFSNLGFFYAPDSRKIRRGKLSGYVFGADSKPVEASDLSNIPFLVAEYNTLSLDTAKLVSRYRYESGYGEGAVIKPSYYAPYGNSRFYSLKVLDENFIQLTRPFPYYVMAISSRKLKYPESLRNIEGFKPNIRTPDFKHTISKLNRRLHKFHSKSKLD